MSRQLILFRHGRRWRPAAMVSMAAILFLITACGGSSDGPTGSSGGHVLMIDVSLISSTSPTPIQGAELLVDDARVGQAFASTAGSENVRLAQDITFASAGSHRVAVRVTPQRFTSVIYNIVGMAGARDSGGRDRRWWD